MRFSVIAILPMLLLAGCADESRQAPVSTAFLGNGPGSQEPQPLNSLPRGAAADAPMTGRIGNIWSTRVGPAALSQTALDATRAVLFATSGY